eukprot:150253-Rhodomonas_salina.1
MWGNWSRLQGLRTATASPLTTGNNPTASPPSLPSPWMRCLSARLLSSLDSKHATTKWRGGRRKGRGAMGDWWATELYIYERHLGGNNRWGLLQTLRVDSTLH